MVRFTAGHAAFDAVDLIPETESMEVFAHFGLAMHAANVLEHGVANAIFIAALLPRIREFRDADEWGEAIDAHFEQIFALTFGNMIKKLEKTGSYSAALLVQLHETKETRNYLAHQFQRDAADLMLTASGRRRMLERYKAIVREFAEADAALEDEIGPIRRKHGASDEWLNQAYERGLEKVLNEERAADDR